MRCPEFSHKGKVTAFIPHYGHVMSPHAVLGPVDPQLGQYAAASLLKVVAKKPIAESDMPPRCSN